MSLLDLAEDVRQRAHRDYVSNPRPEYCCPDGRSMVVNTTSVVRMSELCRQYHLPLGTVPDEPAFTFIVRDVPQSLRGIERFDGVRFFIRREDDK